VLALIAGVVCALAAVGTGLIYTATTVLDWQAVQIWRVEWLLAAIVAFLAGILLKAVGSAKRDPE
jgi:cytosine/uracil/thiamine/allantoin permease